MTGTSQRFWVDYPQRARDELAQAWDHLVTAAEYGSRQAGEATRRHGTLARRRATLAALALRGELPGSRWRPAAAGLAVGVVLGAAAALAARRRRDSADTGPGQTEPGQEPAVRQRAAAAAGRLREQSTAMVHDLTETAREGVAKVRDRVTSTDQADSDQDERPQPAGADPQRPARDQPDSTSG